MAKATQENAGTYTGTGQEIAAVGRTLLDAYNAREFDRLDAVLAPDGEYRNVATGQVFRGPSGVKQYQRNWATAFPESRVDLTNLVACGARAEALLDRRARGDYVSRPATFPGVRDGDEDRN